MAREKSIMHKLLAIILVAGISACVSHQRKLPNTRQDIKPGDELVQKNEPRPSSLNASSDSGLANTAPNQPGLPKKAPAPENVVPSNPIVALSSQTIDGQPAIIAASASGNVKLVKALLASGAEVDARSPDSGGTALHYAAYFRQLEVVRLLIASGADVNAQDYETGFTPLMQATIRGNVDVARYLISRGANVNATANSGNTAIMLAAIPSLRVPPDLIRLLIDSGADLGIRNEFGYNVSEIAANFNNTEFAELLRPGR
jgi:ankyrin repeat protein